ncbi:MAG: TonB-dependent receptor [Bacteroidota bacterium]
MKKVLYTGLILCMYQAFPGYAQEHDLIFSGSFRDIPFVEFVSAVEQQTGATFYYFDIWVSGVRISAEGSDLSLHNTLTRVLLPAGIHHYIDEFGYVYLSNESPLIPSLKYPDESSVRSSINPGNIESKTISGAEQRYIEGHKFISLDTLVVGNEQSGGNQKEVFIYGKIVDKGTGEPLIGATIWVESLNTGIATDSDGRFNILLSPGKHRVSFNYMGMEPAQVILQVNSGGNLVIQMERDLIPITEVVVRANRYDNVRGTQMGYERLNYQTTKEVPVTLGEKDLLKVALMLPGVQNVGEGSSGFNVRGGSADQNMISVNKVPVYNGSHLFGFFTSFSPDIVKDFSLYKSNLPARYGGRLSSIFDISTRQGNMNNFSARGGISPITAHVAVEGPVVKDKSAFVLSARTTYSDWILNRMEDPVLRNSDASFYDLTASITLEPNEKNLVKAFGYYSNDAFTLGTTNQYAYSNVGGSINLKHWFSSRMTGDMALVFGQYAFSTVNTELEPAGYSHDYRIDHYEIKADYKWLSLGKHKVTFGVNGIYYNLIKGLVEPYGEYSLRYPVDLGVERGLELAGYIADEILLTQGLTLYMGFRYTSFMNLGPAEVPVYAEETGANPGNVTDTLFFSSGQIVKQYSSPEPRISLTYLLGHNNSVKASYNSLQQNIFMLSNTVAISPTDQWKLCDYHLQPPHVDQFSIGYYQDMPGHGMNASVEIYYKQLRDVVEYKDGANFITSPNTETQVVQGNQDAYGLELMIRKNSGKLTGWLAYSYSRSMMLFNSNIPGESINNGLRYPSNYDRPHNLSLVTNYKVTRRLSFSSTLEYITGRPVTYPISIYYLNGIEYMDYSNRNQYRIPDYFRMDLSFNLEGNLKKRKLAHSFWMLSIYNLTGRSNAYSVYFRNESNRIHGYKLSIFGRPVITLSWNYKFGNYATE